MSKSDEAAPKSKSERDVEFAVFMSRYVADMKEKKPKVTKKKKTADAQPDEIDSMSTTATPTPSAKSAPKRVIPSSSSKLPPKRKANDSDDDVHSSDEGGSTRSDLIFMSSDTLDRNTEKCMATLKAKTMKESIVKADASAIDLVCGIGDNKDALQDAFYEFFGYSQTTAQQAMISKEERNREKGLDTFFLRMKSRRMLVAQAPAEDYFSGSVCCFKIQTKFF